MPAPRIIHGHEKDLGGGFKVSRLLPAMGQRSIGPFIFMDHFGPTISHGDPAHDVRPHPHIGLSTVSYLFEGALLHHDSTGARQEIRPGEINWMTAGKGIVHSERAPPQLRGGSYPMHGLQLWCALPRAEEECEPSFQHVPASALPVLERAGTRIRVLVGSLGGARSPVRTTDSTLYLHLSLPPGASLDLGQWGAELPEEMAVYAPSQDLLLNGEPLSARQLAVLRSSQAGASPGDAPSDAPSDAASDAASDAPSNAPSGAASGALSDATPANRQTGAPGFELSAAPWGTEPTELVLIGGARLDGPRHLWWNFVSSRRERIEQAARDWAEGRFPSVAGEDDLIPLPARGP